MTSTSSTRENAAPGSGCAHCGAPIPPDAAASSHAAYCCAGCEAVAGLLRQEGLGRYYALAGGDVTPVGAVPAPRTHAWLEPLLAAAERNAGGPGATLALDLDVQGIHCAACVWLMNETFRRAGGTVITVNPALGKARLGWRRGAFDVDRWVTSVERFGYQLGPSRKGPSAAASSLTWRLGVSVALAMNVMLFSLSFYFGLSPAAGPDGDLFRLFSRLSLVLSTAVVAIGGWPFMAAALRGLRARVLHLDLPIALGILLVYATSVAEVARGRGGELTYFDTLNVFVTLMLLGRWLQERLLQRNRRFLLADDGADGLFVRRIDAGGTIDVVPAPRLRRGDRMLIAPGELVPVEARLDSGPAALSTDWINGEATPRALATGARVAAGSFNAGTGAITLEAEADFAESTLVPLLRQTGTGTPTTTLTATDRPAGARHMRFWDRLARRWVASVLGASALGLLIWLPRGSGRALDVAVALLVVTCPCGIGIALPLAYELVQARLRRAGFFTRSADLMDRLVRVRALVFDKTGTLTLSRLELGNPEAVAALAPEVRDVAYNLACRSNHPAAACIAQALARHGARFDTGADVVEIPGQGLVGRDPGRGAGGVEWRLGRASWAAPGQAVPADSTVLCAHGAPDTHGAPPAVFELREAMRPGAAGQLAALRAAGFDLWLVTGDAPARAARLAAATGIAPDHVRAGRTPADKAADVAAIGADRVLYVGDGANDALAFDAALCAGTVAIDRPVLPGRSDFFLVGAGARLAPLGVALAEARRLRRVARQVLALSLGYNVVAVSAALLGLMSPVRAALFMPLSSLSLILFTVARLADRPRRDAAPRALAAEVAA